MITTVVGNYPKVADGAYSSKLRSARDRWERNELTDAQLKAVEDEVTRAVIAEQEQAGVDVLTDGQIRWDDLLRPLATHIDGFAIQQRLERWFDNNVLFRRPILKRKPSWPGPRFVNEYRFASHCTKKPVKAVLPGPYTFATWCEDQYFASKSKLTLALAEMLNQEAKALAQAGASLIQFDEPSIGFGKTDARLAVEGLRRATQGVSATTAVYTYFGAVNGWLPALMRAPVDIIGIDVVSDPKALSALKRAKITKALAIGCLDARNTKLESVKELHAIFRAVAPLVPSDQLYINPNCGLEFLPHTQALAKIRRLVEAVHAFRG
ncbi:MAG: hypothetical protein HY737_03155 [Candidatus Omnitrophica bacterium]|nr:hypothetical protein [Candidatus Omnitrophota bacterium]